MSDETHDGIVILHGSEIPQEEDAGTGYSGEFQSRLKGFDKLEKAWPMVMQRLRTLMDKENAAKSGGFEVASVEFGIKISGGFDFMLKGTADADVRIVFARPGRDQGD